MTPNNEMTFLEHILELRSRLLKIFFSIMVFSIIGYLNSNLIISFLLYPVSDPHINLQVLKITSIFSTKLMVSVFFGLIISFPVLLYQLLSFIMPAFDNKLTVFKIISIPLLESISLNYTLENYLIYLIWILIISSLVYQLPVLILFTVKMGIIDLKWLKSNRRYVIVTFFILSALFTPPDPLSQLMVALPLIMLYEISIIIVRISSK